MRSGGDVGDDKAVESVVSEGEVFIEEGRLLFSFPFPFAIVFPVPVVVCKANWPIPKPLCPPTLAPSVSTLELDPPKSDPSDPEVINSDPQSCWPRVCVLPHPKDELGDMFTLDRGGKEIEREFEPAAEGEEASSESVGRGPGLALALELASELVEDEEALIDKSTDERSQLDEAGNAKYDLCKSRARLSPALTFPFPKSSLFPISLAPPLSPFSFPFPFILTASPLPPTLPPPAVEISALWKLAGKSLSDDVRNGEPNCDPGVSASRGEPRPAERMENVTGFEWNTCC